MSEPARYKPALAYDGLTQFYDLVMRVTMREATFKSELIRQSALSPGMRVLDVGCGTATLTDMIARSCPTADVTGLDGDRQALDLAERKLGAAARNIRLIQALSFAMPLETGTFDRVYSSLLFHHLSRADKIRTLQDIWRVLKPGGEVHIADWGKARNWPLRGAFYFVQLLDGFDTTADNVSGLLPDFLQQAGFSAVEETCHFATVFGSLSLYRGVKPDQPVRSSNPH